MMGRPLLRTAVWLVLIGWSGAVLAGAANELPDLVGRTWDVRLQPGDSHSPLYPRFSPYGKPVSLTPKSMPELEGFDPLEGRLELGAAADFADGRRFVLLRSAQNGGYDRLIIDRDFDGALDDEQPMITDLHMNRNKWWSRFATFVCVPHQDGEDIAWQDYPLSFWAAVDDVGKAPQAILFTRRGYLAGELVIEGRDYDVLVSDGDNDGVFGAGDYWAVAPAGDPKPWGDHRRIGDFVWADGAAFTLELYGTAGREGRLTAIDPGMTQEEDLANRDRYRADRGAARAGQPLSFRSDVDAAWAEAQQQGRPCFLYFTATWCGSCRMMEQLVYTAQAVVSAAEGVVCIKIDGDLHQGLTQRYGVKGYPTGILFDAAGEEVTRFAGYQSVGQLAPMLQVVGQSQDSAERQAMRLGHLVRARRWDEVRTLLDEQVAAQREDAAAALAFVHPLVQWPEQPAHDIAEAAVRQILATHPDFISALELLAHLTYIDGRHEETMAANRRVVELDPNNVGSLNNIAWMLCEDEHDYAQALVFAERALALAPDELTVLDTHAVICTHLRRFAEAERSLKKIIARPESDGRHRILAYFRLAELCCATDQPQEAAQYFEQSLQLDTRSDVLTPEQRQQAQAFIGRQSQR